MSCRPKDVVSLRVPVHLSKVGKKLISVTFTCGDMPTAFLLSGFTGEKTRVDNSKI